MTHFAEDKSKSAGSGVAGAASAAHEAMDRLKERGEKLNILQGKSERLQDRSLSLSLLLLLLLSLSLLLSLLLLLLLSRARALDLSLSLSQHAPGHI